MSSRKTRRDDIRDLHVLKLVREGRNMSDIARDLGKSIGFARTLVARIREADLAESGETREDVLTAFGVTCPATQHAIKKLLMPGQRGAKSREQDLGEALASVQRAIEIERGGA